MRPLTLLLLVFLAGCARRVPEGDSPAVVDARGGKVSEGEILERLSRAKYVLLGESHDDACVHALQEKVVGLAAGAKLPFALGLEMVTVDKQPVLERFHTGEIGLEALPEALEWETGWGHDWNFYAPSIAAARRAEAPVFGLNVSKEMRAQVGKETMNPWISPTLLPPPETQLSQLEAVFEAHPHGGDFQRFVEVQSLWDSQMAWAAREAAARAGRVIVLVGAGHVEHGWGIQSRLAEFDPGATVLSFIPWQEGGGADFFFACE